MVTLPFYTFLKATVHTVEPVLPPKENDGCLTVELRDIVWEK
jgi:hypothetical protein